MKIIMSADVFYTSLAGKEGKGKEKIIFGTDFTE